MNYPKNTRLLTSRRKQFMRCLGVVFRRVALDDVQKEDTLLEPFRTLQFSSYGDSVFSTLGIARG